MVIPHVNEFAHCVTIYNTHNHTLLWVIGYVIIYSVVNNYYASVGGAPRHTVVVVFVRLSVCVCVILQHAFLRDRDELAMKLAMQL